MTTWAIVNPDGNIISKANVPIVRELGEDERLSYADQLYLPTVIEGPSILMRTHQAEGHLTPAGLKSTLAYIYVIGDNYESVNTIIDELRKVAGEKDISPQFFALPKLKSFWERLMFILNWLFTGKTNN